MRITDHITLIDRTMANCYDVETENGHVLVDAGLRSSGLRIANYYRQIGAKPSVILITHYHTDHIGGLRFLRMSLDRMYIYLLSKLVLRPARIR